VKPHALSAGRGFTLIEVLVALAIVAIGMSAVLSALSSSADTVSYLRDKTFAQWVALNKIATLRISGQQPPTGNSNGDTDYAGRSWHWRQAVVATEVPGVVRIDVSVRPAEVKGGEDNGWVTTVSGISGNSVGTPDGGATPVWGAQQQGPPIGPGGAANGAQPPGTTPPATTGPGTTPIVTPPTTPGQPPAGSRE
jgi:general secretion pathway protein I